MKESPAEPGLAVGSPAGSTSSELATTTKSWNTKNLGLRIGSDCLSAYGAGALVAPLIAIIDR